jgi:hypothetical protein
MRNRSRRDDNLRRQLAYLAARLMAEEGVTDVAFAKHKAARQAGLVEARLLPDNREIEAGLRDYQGLFQSNTQPAELRALRVAALALMKSLGSFHPALVGPVLGGTANQHSEITLQLFADDEKAVALFLVNGRWRYEPLGGVERGAADGRAPFARFRVWAGEAPAVLQVYRPEDERHLARPRASTPEGAATRARIDELEALIGA